MPQPTPDTPAALTIATALTTAAAQGLARIDAQMLLLHALGQLQTLGTQRGRAWLLAHDRDYLEKEQVDYFQHLIQRRLNHEPVAYLVGHKHFYGLQLKITPAVLDPRDDTETLVDWALSLLPPPPTPHATPRTGHCGIFRQVEPPHTASLQVADLGTGSGAIALAIASQRPDVTIHASDASADALDIARSNAQALGFQNIQFHQGHWFEAFSPPQQSNQFSLILSNPPYIAENDPHLTKLHHEPLSALVSKENGLQDLKQIIFSAPAYLQNTAWLLLEHGFDQAPTVQTLLHSAGFHHIQTRTDLGGQPRCTGGQWLSTPE